MDWYTGGYTMLGDPYERQWQPPLTFADRLTTAVSDLRGKASILDTISVEELPSYLIPLQESLLAKKQHSRWTTNDMVIEYLLWELNKCHPSAPPAYEDVEMQDTETKQKKGRGRPKKDNAEYVTEPVTAPITAPVTAPVTAPAPLKSKKNPKGKEMVAPAPVAPAPAPVAPAPAPVAPAPVAPASVSSSEPIHIRRKNIPKHIKTLVWNKYLGVDKAEAKCISCRQERIDVRNFHCGHVVAEANGGDLTINNLRPICAPCNLSMGTRSMNEFTAEFFGWTV